MSNNYHHRSYLLVGDAFCVFSFQQILGCNIILNLMREYASTIKSTDVGLPWEVHFKAKKQFEASDLKRIFKFCVQLLSELVKGDPPYSAAFISFLERLLTICECVLTWGHISPIHILFYYLNNCCIWYNNNYLL